MAISSTVFFFFFSVIFLTMAASKSPSCHSPPVKPTIPLINFLQRLESTALQTFGHLNFDPKLYVDLPLKLNLSAAESAFNELPRLENGSVSTEVLRGFLESYLGDAGSDLVPVVPADFVPEPVDFLPKVENLEVRKWALEVHSLWKNLSRKVDEHVKMQPNFHTLLPLPEPIIIPGSRFREVYYWDSYWIIRGLLASKMYDSAKAIVNNLIFLIDKFGYVLNGARAYYTNRSEPPLLSAMIFEIYQRTGDLKLLRRALPSLLKEYDFWSSGIHKVTIQDTQGRKHALSRYFAMWNKPRPESATIDEEFASKLKSIFAKEIFYKEVASTAESGWDFSTRWMREEPNKYSGIIGGCLTGKNISNQDLRKKIACIDVARNHSDLTTLATTSIVPVDLNSYILQMELNIASFARIIGENDVGEKFTTASQNRLEAMNSIFWNAKMDQWLDYWIINDSKCKEVHIWEECNQNLNVFASNFIPLWIERFNSDGATVKKVMKSLKSSGLLHAAGVATSLARSGQQWDFPNGWAPLQHMIVEGLVKSGTREARLVAEDIVVRWVRTNYAAYKKTRHMHEKYDVEACGDIGGGGEYNPQTGFGWSNGVLLAFLEEFGWPRDRKIDC